MRMRMDMDMERIHTYVFLRVRILLYLQHDITGGATQYACPIRPLDGSSGCLSGCAAVGLGFMKHSACICTLSSVCTVRVYIHYQTQHCMRVYTLLYTALYACIYTIIHSTVCVYIQTLLLVTRKGSYTSNRSHMPYVLKFDVLVSISPMHYIHLSPYYRPRSLHTYIYLTGNAKHFTTH